ncbi:MAG: hypothetical protein JEY97_13875 [Bacteroidales bacterium]|nr:hypothetical protein [Bacteroidales bacterium]
MVRWSLGYLFTWECFFENIKHPSLRVKKIGGHKHKWEASIDMFYRFAEKKNLIPL